MTVRQMLASTGCLYFGFLTFVHSSAVNCETDLRSERCQFTWSQYVTREEENSHCGWKWISRRLVCPSPYGAGAEDVILSRNDPRVPGPWKHRRWDARTLATLGLLKKSFEAGGSGKQGMSWIHETDLNAFFDRALIDGTMCGTYIASLPNSVSQKEFM